MATFSISGSGTHALTASTTGLRLTITTLSNIGGSGRSNPVAKYGQGLIRFDDGAGAFWEPVPILGGPQFIPVPTGATEISYAMLGGAVVSVVEVIGGTVFFSAPPQSIETLTDVLVSSVSDGQVLAWNAGAGKWENATPASGGSLTTASVDLGSNISLVAGTWTDVLSLSLAAGTWLVFACAHIQASLNSALNARILVGSTTECAAEFTTSSGWRSSPVLISPPLVLSVTTTVTLQVNSDPQTGTVEKNLFDLNTIGPATYMRALKVA